MVADKLQQQWSPEQIAGWLKQLFTEHQEYRVSRYLEKDLEDAILRELDDAAQAGAGLAERAPRPPVEQ